MRTVAEDKFDESLLQILACPLCKKELKYNKQKKKLICKKCKRKYPVRDQIPSFDATLDTGGWLVLARKIIDFSLFCSIF